MIPIINPYRFGVAAGAPHWQELGRTTLGSAGDTINVTGLTAKPYMMVLGHSFGSGSPDVTATTNSDTGSNYASRWMDNGSGENTGTNRTSMLYDSVGGAFNHKFNAGFINNVSSQEKLSINHSVDSDSSSASNIPSRSETVSKWANTSNAITSFQLKSTVNFDSGSEVVVLGYDPADTTGTSVWEELASVELSSVGDEIDSGTFTAKKYLWVQVSALQSGNLDNVKIRFNNDSGSNYAYRHNGNGAGDSTNVSDSGINYVAVNAAHDHFLNMFIINKSDKEKLVIMEQIRNPTGAGNAPNRRELAAKWANTSSQITSVKSVNGGSGDYAVGSRIKVWGFD